jgi:hypothetical protein
MKAYLHVRDAKTELMPLVLGTSLFYGLPLITVLRSAVPDKSRRRTVLSEWREAGFITRDPITDSFAWSTLVKERINSSPTLGLKSTLSPLALDMSRPNPPPAVLTLVRAFQRRSAQSPNAKTVQDSRAFALFRSLSKVYKPLFIMNQVDPFFLAAERSVVPDTSLQAYTSWLDRSASPDDRELVKKEVYARPTPKPKAKT